MGDFNIQSYRDICLVDGNVHPEGCEITQLTEPTHNQEIHMVGCSATEYTPAGYLAGAARHNIFAQVLSELLGLRYLLRVTSTFFIGCVGPSFANADGSMPESDVERLANQAYDDWLEQGEDGFPYTVILDENDYDNLQPLQPAVEQEVQMTRLKALIVALALGKECIQEQLGEGAQKRLVAALARVNVTNLPTHGRAFTMAEYNQFRRWIFQFPALIRRIVNLSRNPLAGTTDLMRSIFTQALLWNKGASLVSARFVYKYIREANASALASGEIAGEVQGFIGRWDALMQEHGDNFPFLGICAPQIAESLSRANYPTLYTLSYAWFQIHGTASQRRIQFVQKGELGEQQILSMNRQVMNWRRQAALVANDEYRNLMGIPAEFVPQYQ